MTGKSELRARFSAIRDSLPDVSSDIVMKLRDNRYIKEADYLLLFSAIRSEIDVSSLISYAGKNTRIGYPRCIPSEKRLDFCVCHDRDDLVEGFRGIKEPSSSCRVISADEYTGRSVCIVPGLVFGRDMYRIGYGGGYYDRFLSGFPGIKIGVANSECIVDITEHDTFDIQCDIIITENFCLGRD